MIKPEVIVWVLLCVCVCMGAAGKRVLPMLLRSHRLEPETQRNFGTVTKTVLLFLLLSSAWGTLRCW